ncbi:MAG: proton-coupled thiamine transporter YuaJ [Oscillospiraceae bacterium]|nr:proton-coupled thiamine transporter YuaJ [Oscillospiraceae bacterium]
MQKQSSHTQLRALCEGAIMLAIATALSYLKIWEMPWGGSITLEMLPIFVYCVRWGLGRSMLVSVVYSLIQMLTAGGFAIGWQSVIGDYLLAFSVLGVGGAFWRMKGGFYWGAAAGSVLRFLVHYVVGATVWAEYMPPEFFGMTMTSPWFYSFLYNGFYMAIDLALVLLIGAIAQKPLGKWMKPAVQKA